MKVLESATRKAVTNGIDSFLKGDIQVRGSHHTALHWSQHLDVVGADAVSLGNAVAHDVHDFLRRPLGVFLLNKEEVGRAPVADIRESSLVDLVGIGDDTARLCLTENARQSDDGHCARVDDVAEHVACSHAGQLVDVADKYQAHRERHGLQQRVHQDNVYHRRLVHYQEVAVQRILVITPVALGRVELQQAVDSLGLLTRGLAHSLGSTTSGGCQQYALAESLKRGDDA